jgi:hypothetical protein
MGMMERVEARSAFTAKVTALVSNKWMAAAVRIIKEVVLTPITVI